MSAVIAGLVTLFFTALLTVSGVGAAFILIPVFVALQVEVHQAMATALLLNAIAMSAASAWFIRKKLVVFEIAVPMLLMGSVTAPICAYASNYINRTPLLWMFALFCVIAGLMMLLFTPKPRNEGMSRKKLILIGLIMGFISGIGGGLLGVGGGNMIVAVLIVLGLEAKKATATTAFIVIFVSFAGFLGHVQTGVAEGAILAVAAGCALVGALIGAWLMTDKLAAGQVKRVIGGVLLFIATKVIWDLVV